jgi:hypothetical protein
MGLVHKCFAWVHCVVEIMVARMLSCVPTLMGAVLMMLLCQFEETIDKWNVGELLHVI